MAVALWWKSKPYWKEVQMREGKRKSRKLTDDEGMFLWNSSSLPLKYCSP